MNINNKKINHAMVSNEKIILRIISTFLKNKQYQYFNNLKLLIGLIMIIIKCNF